MRVRYRVFGSSSSDSYSNERNLMFLRRLDEAFFARMSWSAVLRASNARPNSATVGPTIPEVAPFGLALLSLKTTGVVELVKKFTNKLATLLWPELRFRVVRAFQTLFQ
jgi:hypothetical protein